jgi:hypothetical protein
VAEVVEEETQPLQDAHEVVLVGQTLVVVEEVLDQIVLARLVDQAKLFLEFQFLHLFQLVVLDLLQNISVPDTKRMCGTVLVILHSVKERIKWRTLLK